MNKIIQSQFEKFHGTIKLDMDDLRKVIEKRDMLIDEIRAYLKKKSEKEEKPLITFTNINQGSYPTGTGIEPAFDTHDYDIDSALIFNVSKKDYNPLQVKGWVHEALDIQFRTVEWKKPCIRVQYKENGLPNFHVDFAIYSSENSNEDSKTYLAKGKPTLASSQNVWEESQPKKLLELIGSKFTDQKEKSQFKRVIRYLKRWKDTKFSSANGKPHGIAITALAYNGFKPYVKNYFNNEEQTDDHKACLEFVGYIINCFSFFTDRISVHLPVSPGNDLFAKMQVGQCKDFKAKLEKLQTALSDAYDETDPHEACKLLQKQFGDDFPVPVKEETGQSRTKSLIGTNESA